MKNKKEIMQILRRQGFAIIFAVAALFAAVLYTFAWFKSQEKLHTLTQVEAPSTLAIKGGNANDITMVDLSGIDLTAGQSAYFIFCVAGSGGSEYLIELAHTTNVAFNYQIYKAASNDTANDFVYIDPNTSTPYYYTQGEALGGSYLNKSALTGISDGKLKAKTYPTDGGTAYVNVQDNADPLYWLSSAITPVSLVDDTFCDYYILQVTWDKSLINEKETDLVYLLAQNATV